MVAIGNLLGNLVNGASTTITQRNAAVGPSQVSSTPSLLNADNYQIGTGTTAYGTSVLAAKGPIVSGTPELNEQLKAQMLQAQLRGSAGVTARGVNVSASTQVANGSVSSNQSGTLAPVSGSVTSKGGATYALNDVTVTQNVTNDTTSTTLGSGATNTDKNTGVAVAIHSSGATSQPGAKVKIAGTGNSPEEAIANAVSSSGAMKHDVESMSTSTTTNGNLKETSTEVVQGQPMTPDQFPGGKPTASGYTATATGTVQNRNQVAAETLAPYPKGTGATLANGEQVVFTPGVDAKGKPTQAARDYTDLAKATGVAPNATDLNSTRETLNAKYGTGIASDKSRIGAQYVTGLQDAVVQRYNGLANIGRDAAAVVDDKGQVIPEKLTAFKQQYANNPEAAALLEKAGIKGGMASFDGSLAQVGQLQKATIDEVKQLGAALDPKNPMANHPNLQALRKEIENVAGNRTILQPLTSEELANRVTHQHSSSSAVHGSANLHSVKAQVVQVKDPNSGAVSYYATGTATLAK